MYSHDGGLRCETVGAAFENEGAVVVGVDDASDVASQVVAGFGEENGEVGFVEVVCEGGAGDAAADDEAVYGGCRGRGGKGGQCAWFLVGVRGVGWSEGERWGEPA